MNDKTVSYLRVGVIVVLLLGVAIVYFVKVKRDFMDNKKIVNAQSIDSIVSNSDINLSKYRVMEIPEECRLPDYEEDINWWKEHLSHHQNTLFCLDDYFS